MRWIQTFCVSNDLEPLIVSENDLEPLIILSSPPLPRLRFYCDMCYHTWCTGNGTQGFLHARQAYHKLSHILSLKNK